MNIKVDYDLTEGGQKSRRQAMTKTFMRLGTRPENYKPYYASACYQEITHCQLCGAALEYNFSLIHVEDPDFTKGLSLKVGSDCVYNFAKIYMPTQAEQILITLQKAIEKNKVNRFRDANPGIFEDNKTMLAQVNTLARPVSQLKQYPTVKHFLLINRELTRQEYLSGPKLAAFKNFKLWLDSGAGQKLVADHLAFKQQPPTIAEVYATHQKFYQTYFTFGPLLHYYRFIPNLTNPAFSDLEQAVMESRLNELLKKLPLQPWLDQVCALWSLYVQWFTTMDTDLSVPAQINRLQVLNDYEINRWLTTRALDKSAIIAITPSELTKKLSALPPVWRKKIKIILATARQQAINQKRKRHEKN